MGILGFFKRDRKRGRRSGEATPAPPPQKPQKAAEKGVPYDVVERELEEAVSALNAVKGRLGNPFAIPGGVDLRTVVRRAWLEHLFANVDPGVISDPRLRRTVEELRRDLTHPLFLRQKELEDIERILLRESPVARELFAHYYEKRSYEKRSKDPHGSALKYFLSAGTFTDPLAWKIAEGIAEQHRIPEDHPQRRLYTPGGLYLPDLRQAISLLANKAVVRPKLVLPAEFHEKVSSSEDPLEELRSHKISPVYDVAPSALDRAHPHIKQFVDIAANEFAKLISPKQDLMELHREYSALEEKNPFAQTSTKELQCARCCSRVLLQRSSPYLRTGEALAQAVGRVAVCFIV